METKNQNTIFLIRSFTIRNAHKSPKKARLIPLKPRSVYIKYDQPGVTGRMLLPETSVIVDARTGRFKLLNRVSQMYYLDFIADPLTFSTISWSQDVSESCKSTMNVEVTLQLQETRGDLETRTFTKQIQPNSHPKLQQKCQFSSYIGLYYAWKADQSVLHFVKLGSMVCGITSFQVKDVFGSTLQAFFSTCTEDEIQSEILTVVGHLVEVFRLEFDFQVKRLCFAKSRAPSVNLPHEHRDLVGRTIEVLEILVQVLQKPLEAVLLPAFWQDPEFAWLLQLQSHLTRFQALSIAETVELETLSNIEWVPPYQVGSKWWQNFNEVLGEKFKSEYLARLKATWIRPTEDPSPCMDLWSPATVALGTEIEKYMLYCSDMWGLHTRDLSFEPEFILSDSRSRCATLKVEASPKCFKPLLLEGPPRQLLAYPQFSYVNSFELPGGLSNRTFLIASKNSFIEVDWDDENLMYHISWIDPSSSWLDPLLELSQEDQGLLRYSSVLAWPSTESLSEELPEILHYPLLVEYSLRQILVVCSNLGQLQLLTFEPLARETNKRMKVFQFESLFSGLQVEDLQKALFKYRLDLADPGRCQASYWRETDQRLMLAMVMRDNSDRSQTNKHQLFLGTVAFKKNRDVERANHQTFPCPAEYHRLEFVDYKECHAKVANDCRNLVACNFYFKWLCRHRNVYGVWVLSGGNYRLYSWSGSRFLLCHQKDSKLTLEKKMSELLPFLPGMAQWSPILLRHNSTIKLQADGVSWEYTEYRFKLC